jgi:hypothetical protein
MRGRKVQWTMSNKSKPICDIISPMANQIRCEKKYGHKGDHMWKGFYGIFQQVRVKLTWEKRK